MFGEKSRGALQALEARLLQIAEVGTAMTAPNDMNCREAPVHGRDLRGGLLPSLCAAGSDFGSHLRSGGKVNGRLGFKMGF